MDNFENRRINISLEDLFRDVDFALREEPKADKVLFLIEGADEEDIIILDEYCRRNGIPYHFGYDGSSCLNNGVKYFQVHLKFVKPVVH